MFLVMISSTTVKSDETGYNPYNPRSQHAYTKPSHDPKNFDDVMKTTTPGSSSQRAAYAAASNCFKTGGGYPSLLSNFFFFAFLK
jgi:hypothetical protein